MFSIPGGYDSGTVMVQVAGNGVAQCLLQPAISQKASDALGQFNRVAIGEGEATSVDHLRQSASI